MALPPLPAPALAGPAASEPTRGPGPTVRFQALLETRPASTPPSSGGPEVGPVAVVRPPANPALQPARLLGHVAEAQARMDRILALAASGRTFSPAELLSLQARVAEASQTVDLAGKVLDRVTSGVKQVLQTPV